MAEQLVPENRLERFFSSIVYNTDVPDERRTRLELWLGAILKKNAPPDAPYDRLERWLKEIYENVDYMVQLSGMNVEFWSPTARQLSFLSVAIKPYQELNGYNRPWAGGRGKNLLENNVNNGSRAGITVSANSDGILVLNGTADPSSVIIGNVATGVYGVNGQYDGVKHIPNGRYIASTGNKTDTGARIQICASNDLSSNIVLADFQTDAVIEIDDTYAYNWVRIAVSIGNYDNVVIKPMIRLETISDDEYEPYANVCPIIGFDEVAIKRYGETEDENLVDFPNPLTLVRVGSQAKRYYFDVPLPPGEYRFACNVTNNENFTKVTVVSFARRTESGITSIKQIYIAKDFTGIFNSVVEIGEEFDTVDIFIASSNPNDATITMGDIEFSINPLTIDIALGSEVYGGNLNVISGELLTEYGNIPSYNGELLPGRWLSSLDEYTTESIPTTGAQVVYELASPSTTSLTPNQVSTLEGTNHIDAHTINGGVSIEAEVTIKL